MEGWGTQTILFYEMIWCHIWYIHHTTVMYILPGWPGGAYGWDQYGIVAGAAVAHEEGKYHFCIL